MSFPKFPLIRVEWTDSTRIDGWQDFEKVQEYAIEPGWLDCESIGYLIADQPDRIIIAHSVCSTGALGICAIPAAAITKRTLLRNRGSEKCPTPPQE